MKQWMMLAIAGVAGYAAYKWYMNHKASGQPLFQFAGISTPGTNINPYNDVAGVPEFDPTAVTNRPDQVAAALHANDASTLSGSLLYEPAFGPQTNQTGGVPVF